MKQIEGFKGIDEITKLYPYYRSDVFAASLIESGFSPEQVIILRRDGSKGGYAHDIDKIQVKYPYLYPDNPYIEIQTGAEGIYDNMPEDMFFVSDLSHRERDKHYVVSRIRENRKREQDIRRVFSLYEIESDAFRIEMSREELRYQQLALYPRLRDLFSHYWDVVSLMRNDELIRFLKIIPFVSDMRGDYKKASDAISYILGISVEISSHKLRVKPREYDIEEYGATILGVNFILENNYEYIIEEHILLTLSSIERDLYPLYFDNNDYNKIVLFLTEMFVESTKRIDFQITCNVNSREFYIGDSENISYFGLNTYL